MELFNQETGEKIKVSSFFPPEDVLRESENECIVRDGDLVKVIVMINGKPKPIWYASLEAYDEYISHSLESDNRFWASVLWNQNKSI